MLVTVRQFDLYEVINKFGMLSLLTLKYWTVMGLAVTFYQGDSNF